MRGILKGVNVQFVAFPWMLSYRFPPLKCVYSWGLLYGSGLRACRQPLEPRTHFFLSHGFLTYFQAGFRALTFKTSSFCDKLQRKTIHESIPGVFMAQYPNLSRGKDILHSAPTIFSLETTFGLPQEQWRHSGNPLCDVIVLGEAQTFRAISQTSHFVIYTPDKSDDFSTNN